MTWQTPPLLTSGSTASLTLCRGTSSLNSTLAKRRQAPGQAPVPLIRRPDTWRRIPGVEQNGVQQQHPSVSTTWMPWTDSVRHKVVALLFQDHDTFWLQDAIDASGTTFPVS